MILALKFREKNVAWRLCFGGVECNLSVKETLLVWHGFFVATRTFGEGLYMHFVDHMERKKSKTIY